MEEIIIIFVEGHGETIFFEKLINCLISEKNKRIKEYKIENMKAIGNYKNKALRIYKNRYKIIPNCKKTILFNYDTDVFRKEPYPLDWKEIEEKFKKEDKNCEIFHIRVEENLEDILLLDLDGLIKFLEIEDNTDYIELLLSKKDTGYDKIKYLYKIGSNIYTKNGRELEKLLETFDMNKVIDSNLECINILIEKITY